jgi:hypothetical protein
MAWSGGNFTRANGNNGWVTDAGLGIGIEAGLHDNQDNDFKDGINQCLNKDGSNSATGNLNLGGFLPTNIGAGTAAAVAIAAGNDVNTGIFAPAADTWAVATNGTERMRITSGGFVFINTTTNFSADKLCLAFGTTENGLGIRDNNDTSGTTFAVFRNSANGICGSVTRVTTTNAVNYNTSSDYRLKKDIQPVENALAKLNQINPVNFVWKDCDIAATGFIAHEIAAVLPDVVSGEKDAVDAEGNPIYQGVDYGKLTPLLAAALKELNAKVEALQARVAELEA